MFGSNICVNHNGSFKTHWERDATTRCQEQNLEKILKGEPQLWGQRVIDRMVIVLASGKHI
eukprot:5913677-Amphidinium_carterae.1